MRVESDFKFIISVRLMKEQTFHEYLGWKSMLVSRKEKQSWKDMLKVEQ